MGVLRSKGGLVILNRLSSLCTFWGCLAILGGGVIVKIYDPYSIRHLLSTKADQPLDGLICAWNIFNLHKV